MPAGNCCSSTGVALCKNTYLCARKTLLPALHFAAFPLRSFPFFMTQDLYQHPDHFLVDELLTDEQKLIRDAVRSYVKKEVTPIIEDYAQRAEFPKQLIKGLGELGCFGPTIPVEYGGAGLDYISYGHYDAGD